jgi:hypothetical protein
MEAGFACSECQLKGTVDLYRVKVGGVVSLRKIDLLLSSSILGV